MEKAKKSLYGVNFITKCTKKNELINFLTELHNSLSDLSQEASERPKGLKQTALHLTSNKILGHSDKEVRILASCCIVDMLRIFAPEAPYTDGDTIRVFEVIISQLRGISTQNLESDFGSKILYIITSFSTVKSCVIPVLMAQSGIAGAEDIVCSLFDSIISSVRADHPDELLGHCSVILQACLEEYEDISDSLMDYLLLPLLPSYKAENVTAYKLIGTILRRLCSTLEPSISTFINRILVGNERSGNRSSSELSDHIYPLIYELHKISPSFLNSILPNICVQLQIEEEDARLKAVILLGNLFTSEFSDYCTEYSRNFREFIGRLNDLSPKVRLEMVENCAILLKNKPNLSHLIEESLVKRLRDPEENIRVSTILRLVEVALNNPLALKTETYLEMKERAKDRKLEVRKTVLIGLTKLYGKFISNHILTFKECTNSFNLNSQYDSSQDQKTTIRSLDSNVNPEVFARLSFVPGVLVNSWGYPEMSQRCLIVHLLQQYLLPISEAVGNKDQTKENEDSDNNSSQETNGDMEESETVSLRRASTLLFIFSTLSEAERSVFSSILSFKSRVRKEFSTFLEHHQELQKSKLASTRKSLSLLTSRRSTKDNTDTEKGPKGVKRRSRRSKSSDVVDEASSEVSKELSLNLEEKLDVDGNGLIQSEEKVHRSMLRLTQLLPPADRKAAPLEALLSTRDKTIFRHLNACVSPLDSVVQAQKRMGDLRSRLDSKSYLGGEYIGSLYEMAGFLECNVWVVRGLLEFLLVQKEVEVEELGGNLMRPVIVNLLVLLAKNSSKCFRGAEDLLAQWLTSSMDNISETKKAKKSNLKKKKFISYPSENKEEILKIFEVFSGISRTLSSDIERENELMEFCTVLNNQLDNCSDPNISYRLAETLGMMFYHSSSPAFVEFATDFLDKISSSDVLNIENPDISIKLVALSAAIMIPATVYTDRRSTAIPIVGLFQIINSVKSNVLDFAFSQVLNRTTTDGEMSDENVSPSVVMSTIHAMTSVLLAEEEHKQWLRQQENVLNSCTTKSSSSVLDSPNQKKDFLRPSQEFSTLVDLLVEILESNGSQCGSHRFSKKSRQFVRDSAVYNVMRLTRLNIFSGLLTTTQWHQVGFSFSACLRKQPVLLEEESEEPSEDPSTEVSSGDQFLDVVPLLLPSIREGIQALPLHPKFLVYLVLVTIDTSAEVSPWGKTVSETAQDLLRFSVMRLRNTHEELCSRALQKQQKDPSQSSQESQIALQKLVASHMPESVLPYLLHLLSYHPDFPTSATLDTDSDKAAMKRLVGGIQLLLRTLNQTLQQESSNLSYLLKQLSLINQQYLDRHDRENIGLHYITRVTIRLLHDQVKTAENVQEYPADIKLPSELFMKKDEKMRKKIGVKEAKTEAMREKDLENSLAEGLEEAEQSIDLVIQLATHPSKGKGVKNKTKTVTRSKNEKTKPLTENHEFELSHDDDDESVEIGKKRKSPTKGKKEKGVGQGPKKIPREEPTRALPKRTAKAVVSNYEEKEVSEKEVLEWEETAAKKKKIVNSSTVASNKSGASPSAMFWKDREKGVFNINDSHGSQSERKSYPAASVEGKKGIQDFGFNRKRRFSSNSAALTMDSSQPTLDNDLLVDNVKLKKKVTAVETERLNKEDNKRSTNKPKTSGKSIKKSETQEEEFEDSESVESGKIKFESKGKKGKTTGKTVKKGLKERKENVSLKGEKGNKSGKGKRGTNSTNLFEVL